jgi:CRP/FNR family cyclic AMP-dependent transcriptional regulator
VADAPLDLLKRVPLFEGLDKAELEGVARLMKQRTFSAGQAITSEGQGGVGFFVVEDGTAKVTVRGEERGAIGAGDYFGEIALIDDDSTRSATITAETDLRCYGMTPWEFRPLVQENASIGWKLLQAMAKKLRAAEKHQV